MPRDSRITLHFLGRPPRFILRSASLAKWEANQGGLQCTKIKSPQIALRLIFIGLGETPPVIIVGLLDQHTGSGLPPQRFPVGSLTQRQIPFPQQRPLSKSLYLNSSLRISAPQDKRRQLLQRPHTWPRRRTRSRPAKVSDKLVTRDFGTRTRGFSAADDLGLAVCVMPGTELAFAGEVACLPTGLLQ